MSRKLNKSVARDLQHEAVVLSKKISADGKGEDPAVQALMSEEFASMNNKEALNVALALQEIVRGMGSINQNQHLLAEELRKLRERMDQQDKINAQYEANRVKFVEDAQKHGDKLRVTDPAKKAEMVSQVQRALASKIATAKMERAQQTKRQIEKLKSEPLETVISAGEFEFVSQNGQAVPVLRSTIIRVGNLSWELKPNVPTQVPASVAAAYRETIRAKQEAQARQAVFQIPESGKMGPEHEQGRVLMNMRKVDEEYKLRHSPDIALG